MGRCWQWKSCASHAWLPSGKVRLQLLRCGLNLCLILIHVGLQAIQPQAQPPALLMVDVMAATGIEDLLGRGTAGVAPHELLCSLQWADSSSKEGAGEGCPAQCRWMLSKLS